MAPGTSRMNALSTISIVVIETRVRGDREADGAPERDARAEHRAERERVAEEEREHDREADRGGVAPAERGARSPCPRISPIAQPVRQCAVASSAIRFSEGLASPPLSLPVSSL